MQKWNKAICILVIFVNAGCTFSQHVKISEKPIKQKVILGEESANIKAMEYFGFSKMEGFSVERKLEKVSIVNTSSDKTPILHEKINNRDIWKATYTDITLVPHRGYPDSVDYPRTFDVYIDPDDGTLLKIESIYAGTNIDFAPEPSIERAEKEIDGSRYRFLGFASPDSNYVSFFDIMNGMGPRNFKQLKASLIMIPGKSDDNPVAVWFVIYRGIDPYLPKSRGADLSIKEAYNYATFVYNAKTGNMMGTTSVPSVELDKLK